MTISLTNLIADIEAKIAAANSSTSTDELLKIIKAARAANTIANTYDSAGAMPVDSANVGNVLMSASDNFLYVLDSAGGSWSTIIYIPPEPPSWDIQGTSYGYASAGSPGPGVTIDKWPFASDGNATDVGDIDASAYDTIGHSSLTYGYVSGGEPSSRRTRVRRFAFASDGDADLMSAVLIGPGIRGAASSSTESHGYIHGHSQDSPTARKVQRFAYASDEDAAETGDADDMGVYCVGHSSATHGYAAAGFNDMSGIFKYAFGSSTTMSDVGDLPTTAYFGGSQSDQVNGYGYVAGGHPTTNAIRRFSFSSDGAGTDHSDLHTAVRYNTTGTQSTVSGYVAGAQNSNQIQKFPFSDNSTGTDVGDLTLARSRSSAHQI